MVAEQMAVSHPDQTEGVPSDASGGDAGGAAMAGLPGNLIDFRTNWIRNTLASQSKRIGYAKIASARKTIQTAT